MPFFGYEWPTTGDTLTAQAQGQATVITYGQELASGHTMYWDAATDTAWTSYLVGKQWHEAFFEDPYSVYLAATLANSFGLGGVGAWALGMDGSGDQIMISALGGKAPATTNLVSGPSQTSSSPTGPEVATTTSSTTTPPTQPAATTLSTSETASSSTSTTSTTTASTTTTTTTTTTTAPMTYQGLWQNTSVSLIPSDDVHGQPTLIGTLEGFTTNDPAFACLEDEATLEVYSFSSDPTHDYVIAQSPTDCTDGTFAFEVPASGNSTSTTPTSG